MAQSQMRQNCFLSKELSGLIVRLRQKALPVSSEHDGEGMTWGKMEKNRNDEFNPSGQPWSPDQGYPT